MKNVLGVILFGLAVSGCTTAGPYVTNISSDGDNGLNIEKCAVKLNAFMGTVSTTECTSAFEAEKKLKYNKARQGDAKMRRACWQR